jgi:hypothetical protein
MYIFELRRCPPFKALSYTWGSPYPVHSIQIDGKPFSVRQNLWEFLVTTEEYQTWLWIDAICIDQTSNRERNHQVQFMDQIFRSANEVLIWLGPEADDSRLAIDYLHFWNPFYQNRHPKKIAEDSKELATRKKAVRREFVVQTQAIEALLRRPYWSRVWVVQEILHARADYPLRKISRAVDNILSFHRVAFTDTFLHTRVDGLFGSECTRS